MNSRQVEAQVRSVVAGLDLLSLMHHLEMAGWCWKLKSRNMEGRREYRARVYYYYSHLGYPPGCYESSDNPVEAMTASLARAVVGMKKRGYKVTLSNLQVTPPPMEVKDVRE